MKTLADRAYELSIVADACRQGTHEMTPAGWEDFCQCLDNIVQDLVAIETAIHRKRPAAAPARKPVSNIVAFANHPSAARRNQDIMTNALKAVRDIVKNDCQGDNLQGDWLDDARRGGFPSFDGVPFSDGGDVA